MGIEDCRAHRNRTLPEGIELRATGTTFCAFDRDDGRTLYSQGPAGEITLGQAFEQRGAEANKSIGSQASEGSEGSKGPHVLCEGFGGWKFRRSAISCCATNARLSVPNSSRTRPSSFGHAFGCAASYARCGCLRIT